MNYMINDQASKEVAIAFANWVVLARMWESHLTPDEQYACWMDGLDAVAELRAEDDEMAKYDDFERQLEYMSGAYED